MEKEESKTEKKSLTEWINEHPKTVFGIRCALWVLAAAVLPFIFIAWRYGIFTQQSQIKLTGWGFIAIIIVIIFLITLMRYVYKGLKPGITKQCLTGLTAVILPLTILYLLIISIQENLEAFKQALGCVILCEMVAIPINPFPEWLEKRKIEQGKEKVETVSDIVWDKFFSRKDKEDK